MISQKDGVLKKSNTGLLREAYEKFGKPGSAIRDGFGVIAYGLGKEILVAKPKPYGYIVSCNKTLVDYGSDIIMYIGQNDAFYLFKIDQIKNSPESFVNLRGTIEMFNFNIRLGKRVEGRK